MSCTDTTTDLKGSPANGQRSGQAFACHGIGMAVRMQAFSPLSYSSLEGDCEKEQLYEAQQTSGVPVVGGCQKQPCSNAPAMRQEIMPKFQSTAS